MHKGPLGVSTKCDCKACEIFHQADIAKQYFLANNGDDYVDHGMRTTWMIMMIAPSMMIRNTLMMMMRPGIGKMRCAACEIFKQRDIANQTGNPVIDHHDGDETLIDE